MRWPDLPLSFDLADLRGYHYHSGVVFAAYAAGNPGAVALGGRYDEVGPGLRPRRGRRPAFRMDLRELARLVPTAEPPRGAILAPWPEDDALHAEIERLRAQGEIVIAALPGHEGHGAKPAATACWCGVATNGLSRSSRKN